MQKTIDKLAVKLYEDLQIKLCENLPLNSTIYEEKGICTRPNKECTYCIENSIEYFCHKKTYTMDQELNPV